MTHQDLCDLDRVQRGALSQIVPGHEKSKAVLDGRIVAYAADENQIPSGRGQRIGHLSQLHPLCSAQEIGRLCVAKTKSGRIGDEVRRGLRVI